MFGDSEGHRDKDTLLTGLDNSIQMVDNETLVGLPVRPRYRW